MRYSYCWDVTMDIVPDVSGQYSRLSSKVSMSKMKDSGRIPSWGFVPLRIRPVTYLETSGHLYFSTIQIKFILTVFTCSFFLKVTVFRANLAPKFSIFCLPLLSTCLTTQSAQTSKFYLTYSNFTR